eukprot:TRINITY_DN381_c0_g1_i1.p1 TRINITY_DN381_c0_g1~~TRINITY_DN381_c0_g1_i1.p1  ORF type:complete len:252 (+),score=90.33 TRINITY_DN381_c0_g1_i1:63-758(+)
MADVPMTAAGEVDWEAAWTVIVGGGAQMWRASDELARKYTETALDVIERNCGSGPQTLLVTLCGDSPFVAAAWRKGHTVNAIELAPTACAALREQFPGEWEEEKAGAHTVYRLKEGRMTLWQGDVFAPCEGMPQNDCVVDKDAWGAMPRSRCDEYARVVAGYTKPGGVVYLEGVLRLEDVSSGPPFHADRDAVATSWEKAGVEYKEELGQMYEIPMPIFTQRSHLMKKRIE